MDDVKVSKNKKKKKWYGKKATASKKKVTRRDLESLAEVFNKKNHKD